MFGPLLCERSSHVLLEDWFHQDGKTIAWYYWLVEQHPLARWVPPRHILRCGRPVLCQPWYWINCKCRHFLTVFRDGHLNQQARENPQPKARASWAPSWESYMWRNFLWVWASSAAQPMSPSSSTSWTTHRCLRSGPASAGPYLQVSPSTTSGASDSEWRIKVFVLTNLL